MVKPMEEIIGESDRVVQACRQEMKRQGFDTDKVKAKLDANYIGIHSELRKMKTILSNKQNLTKQEEQFYYKLSDILCYSDRASREMRRSVNRKLEKVMIVWTNQLNRLYAEKVIRLKDKLPFPPIFGMDLAKSGLFVEYQLDENGELPKYFKLCRKFETTMKRSRGEHMMQTIPSQLQVKIKGFISASLDNEKFPHKFHLFDKDHKPITTFHSADKGGICLGTIDSSEFRNNFKAAVESQRWDKVNEIFNEIEKMFMTVFEGAAYGSSRSVVKDRKDAFHQKVSKLWRYLRHEIDENGNPPQEENENENQDQEEE